MIFSIEFSYARIYYQNETSIENKPGIVKMIVSTITTSGVDLLTMLFGEPEMWIEPTELKPRILDSN